MNGNILRTSCLVLTFGLGFGLTANLCRAEEEVINLESTIIGSQEQPKVLYIIPWKQANSLERLESSLPQTINHVFLHQEYSELQREIKLLQPAQQE
jgi:hypothetical protein